MAKNKHAVALGRIGGNRNTPAQQAARSANGRKGGRKPKYRLHNGRLQTIANGTWEYVLIGQPTRAIREALRRLRQVDPLT